MQRGPKYSIVIPVYNRPQELEELLESLLPQTFKDFEVIIIEDGSTIKADKVCQRYASVLTLSYFFKENTGPGPSRNYGFARAKGDYFVIFDSDCILPSTYFSSVNAAMALHQFDAWGGPDKAHDQFTPLQQAMGFTMSAFITTGGIRGGKKRVGSFQPRSFNMGISRGVFNATGGFHFDRFAEDIEFSIRLKKAGYKVGLIPEAYVFHKRRTNLNQFAKQVYNFGKGRALVGKTHRGEIKITHWFPTVFATGLLLSLAVAFINPWGIIGLGLYSLYFIFVAIFAFLNTSSLKVSFLSIPSAFIQLTGYGLGFLTERLK